MKVSNILDIFFETIFEKVFSFVAFTLLLAVNILSIIILANILLTASVAKHEYNRQFSMDENFLCVVYIGLFQICFMVLSFIFSEHKIAIFNLITFVLILPSELINYKFYSCFTTTQTEILIARSILVIFLISFVILRSLFTSMKEMDNLIKIKNQILTFLAFISSLVIIFLNIKMLYVFIASSNSSSLFKTSQIQIGFFNRVEFNLIEKGIYIQDDSFYHRIVGSLSEVMSFRNQNEEFTRFDDNIFNDLNFYSHEKKLVFTIECSNKTRVIFNDCIDADSKNLKIILKYSRSGDPYPSYNCYINKKSNEFNEICNHLLLLDHLELIMIQFYNDKIGLAWNGFGKCMQPNVRLKTDLTIY
jgi:hypothetical protein